MVNTGIIIEHKSSFLNVAAFLEGMKRTFWILGGIILVVIITGVLLVQYTTTIIAPAVLSEEFDAIIIPGQGVRDGILWGDAPQRIMLAATIAQIQNKKPFIILSGYGRGYIPREEREIEATLMYQQLVPLLEKEGISQEIVLLENQSHHTLENAIYSQKLLPSGTQKILVLSSSKSYYRTKLIFSSILSEYDVKVYSLTTQTQCQKIQEIPRTLATLPMLLIPTDVAKLMLTKTLYLHSLGEQNQGSSLISPSLCGG